MLFSRRKYVETIGAAGLTLATPLTLARAANWYDGAPAFKGDQRSYTPRHTPSVTSDHPFLGPNGESMTLAAYKGRIVLVNFWATWCPPCIKEMPSLNALQERLGGADFKVVTISLDNPVPEGTTDPALTFLEDKGLAALRFHRATDPQALYNAFRLGALPVSLMLGPNGMIIGTLAGSADWASPEAINLIEFLIQHAPNN